MIITGCDERFFSALQKGELRGTIACVRGGASSDSGARPDNFGGERWEAVRDWRKEMITCLLQMGIVPFVGCLI